MDALRKTSHRVSEQLVPLAPQHGYPLSDAAEELEGYWSDANDENSGKNPEFFVHLCVSDIKRFRVPAARARLPINRSGFYEDYRSGHEWMSSVLAYLRFRSGSSWRKLEDPEDREHPDYEDYTGAVRLLLKSYFNDPDTRRWFSPEHGDDLTFRRLMESVYSEMGFEVRA